MRLPRHMINSLTAIANIAFHIAIQQGKSDLVKNESDDEKRNGRKK